MPVLADRDRLVFLEANFKIRDHFHEHFVNVSFPDYIIKSYISPNGISLCRIVFSRKVTADFSRMTA